MDLSTQAAAERPGLDRKSVGAVVLGNALEFYDFTVYAFFAKPIGEAFFPPPMPATACSRPSPCSASATSCGRSAAW